MMQSWKQTKDDLERQLAEAQERVFDLEEGMTATGLGLTKEKRQLKREVRRYKALAERRGEAFKARGYHSPEDCWSRKYEVPHGTICHYCVPALNATPK
jgi:predicted  nucleic acid-binding Zn-ribbon protein